MSSLETTSLLFAYTASVGGGIVGYANLPSVAVDVTCCTWFEVLTSTTGMVAGSEYDSAFCVGHESDITEKALPLWCFNKVVS